MLTLGATPPPILEKLTIWFFFNPSLIGAWWPTVGGGCRSRWGGEEARREPRVAGGLGGGYPPAPQPPWAPSWRQGIWHQSFITRQIRFTSSSSPSRFPCPCLPKGKKKNVNFYDVPKGLKRSKRVKKGPKTTKKSKNQNCELRGRPPPLFGKSSQFFFFFLDPSLMRKCTYKYFYWITSDPVNLPFNILKFSAPEEDHLVGRYYGVSSLAIRLWQQGDTHPAPWSDR